jgi:hypothetical protein
MCILLIGPVFKLKCVIGKGIKPAKSLFQNVDKAIEFSRDYYDNGNLSERLLELNIADVEKGGRGDKVYIYEYVYECVMYYIYIYMYIYKCAYTYVCAHISIYIYMYIYS